MQLTNQTALITGGTYGIGFGIAQELAKKGCNLILIYHSDETKAQEAKQSLEQHNITITLYQFDISQIDQISERYSVIPQHTILINNAGGVCEEDGSVEDRQQSFNLNFLSVVQLSQAFWQRMGINASKILNISSIYGVKPLAPHYPAYSSAKAALNCYTQLTAKNCKPGQSVNAIAPGCTDTPARSDTSENYKQQVINRTTIKRFITPEEIGKLAVSILESDAIQGQIISIDGGTI